MAKGLLVSVLRNALGDCTNGGVTAKARDCVLVGVGDVFESREGLPALYLSEYRGRKIATPEPLSRALVGASGKWWMFGGNFVYSSDSRFPSDAPIHVYDRYEPPELARLMNACD